MGWPLCLPCPCTAIPQGTDGETEAWDRDMVPPLHGARTHFFLHLERWAAGKPHTSLLLDKEVKLLAAGTARKGSPSTPGSATTCWTAPHGGPPSRVPSEHLGWVDWQRGQVKRQGRAQPCLPSTLEAERGHFQSSRGLRPVRDAGDRAADARPLLCACRMPECRARSSSGQIHNSLSIRPAP